MSMFNSKTAKPLYSAVTAGIVFFCAAQISSGSAANKEEINERTRIAASNMQDAIVIDCQLPGKLIELGGFHRYLTPGKLLRLSAIDCRTRGGEYTLGDLSSGTLSLKRWQPLAEQGSAEAQYYVARIYANGMGGVPVDYAKASEWYQRAAKQKYSAALQELGYLYESGLGVPQDRLLALNLQREASGLGDDLDYAWKLTAAKEEAAQQTAKLSEQLEASNEEMESLRIDLEESRDGWERSRALLGSAENSVLNLRSQLKTLQAQGGGDGAARVKELQAKLTVKETELSQARSGAEKLRADLAARQSQLESRLQNSEATSSQLNELLSARQDEAKSLRARLAQSEQRLIVSQQELGNLRLEYRKEVNQLSAERDELDHIRAGSHGNAGAALLAAKERELDLKSLRVQTLEGELDKLRKGMAGAAAPGGQSAKQTDAQNAQLRAQLGALQARLNEQVKAQQAAQTEITDIRSKSQAERDALLTKMADQLASRTAELEAKQRRIASLESDAAMLKDEATRLREQQTHDAAAKAGEASRMQAAMEQQRTMLEKERESLEQLRMDAARERAAQLADRENLQRQMADAQKSNERDVAALKKEIQARQEMLSAKEERIAVLEKKLADEKMPADKPVMTAGSYPQRGGALAPALALPPAIIPAAATLTAGVSANYYALVIGNNNYRYMQGLLTPANDAQSVADLLEQNYGFKVTRLLDATSDEIMRTLDNFSIELKDSDRLLIYYAGHGGTRDGPPERAFWLGVDADPRIQAGWISAEYVGDKIKQMRAKHVLLVSDSCFSASITHPTTTTIRRDLSEKRFQVQWNRRARMVLTSGQNTPVVDTSGDRNHSLFAKYFISVLRQNSGVMSGEMLSYELSSRMQPEATRMGLKQTPTYTSLQDANHEYGDFFFVPSPKAPVRVAALNDLRD